MQRQLLKARRHHNEQGIAWNASYGDFERVRGNDGDGFVPDFEYVADKAHFLIFLRLFVRLLLCEKCFQHAQRMMLHNCPVQEGFHQCSSHHCESSGLKVLREKGQFKNVVKKSKLSPSTYSNDDRQKWNML